MKATAELPSPAEKAEPDMGFSCICSNEFMILISFKILYKKTSCWSMSVTAQIGYTISPLNLLSVNVLIFCSDNLVFFIHTSIKLNKSGLII